MNSQLSRACQTFLRLFVIAVLALGAAGRSMPAFAETTTPLTDADQDMIDDNDEQALIERFRPYVIFHHCENNFPSTVDYFLDHSALHYHHPAKADHTYLPKPIGNTSDLISQNHNDSNWSGEENERLHGQGFWGTEFYLNADDATHPGQPLGTANIYAHVRYAPEDTHPGMIDVQYWFFYPYNGNLGFSECNNLEGEHEGDWEHITVRVRSDGTPHAAYYAAHSGDDSAWYLPDRGNGAESGYYAEVSGTYRPIVYAAYHSHASYTHAGKFGRGALPPDFTGGGPVWDMAPSQVKNIGEARHPNAGMSWIQFTGSWGENGPVCCPNSHPDGPSGPGLKVSWDAGDGRDRDDSHSGLVVSPPPSPHPIVPPNTNYRFFLGTAVDGTSTEPLSAEVVWGDGTVTTGLSVISNDPNGYAAYHTYATLPGDYTVRSIVSNGEVATYAKWTVFVRYAAAGPPDSEGPQVEIGANPSAPDGPNGWYLGNVTLDVTASDPVSGVFAVRCALDPETPPLTYEDLPQENCAFYTFTPPGASPPGVTVSNEGVHTLYAAAIDLAGNTSVPVSLTFQIDPSPPVIECDVSPLLLHSGDQVVTPSEVYAGASGLNEGASTLSGTVSTDSIGAKPVAFTATDMAGHQTVQACDFDVINQVDVTPTPSTTPAAKEDDGGCTVTANQSIGAPWWLLVPVIAVWSVRRRKGTAM